jgi:hypothetical protein
MLQQITNNLPQYTRPTSLHLGSTMTMAAGAKLFVNASSTATKPSPTSVAGERSDSWMWVSAIGGDTTPPLFEGR